ncbi:choline-sulfatase [Nesterenkonia aurantiaca]|uniref:choline-sulfatase n=1 Tax=Nesterenkonia aurantiaca TaxID=1436010 RepID=UPI003EE51175
MSDDQNISHHTGTVSPPEHSSSVSPPGTVSPPNIVVIQADQMAAQALGAYGDTAAKTPHMDALAEDGAVFDRAYCNSPLCAPSRASMMTGVMPSDLGCFDNGDDFASSVPTFAHRLRHAGYHTALVGRMHFVGADQHHGFEERLTTDVYPADLDMVPDWTLPLEQKLQWYHDADAVFTAGVSKASVQQDFDDEVGFRTLRHLNDRVRANQAAAAAGEEAQPFLMVSSFIHPHDPYEPPQEHWDRFADVEIPDPAHPEVPDIAQDPHSHRLRAMSGFDKRYPDLEQVRNARRAYYAAVSYIDDHVGRIRERLDSLGLSENTVILVTADHGDMLGERGLWYKMSPYERSSRVPLIAYGPEHLVPRGRHQTPVSLLDLMPTLVDLAGAPSPKAAGDSVLEIARREQTGEIGPKDRPVIIEYLAEGTYRPQLSIISGQYKYVICPGDVDQLFDLAADPHELHNAAREDHHAGTVARLRGELDSRYDMEALEAGILESQDQRRLVAEALSMGRKRSFDHNPEPEQRYVRGDFWGALEYGTIREGAR